MAETEQWQLTKHSSEGSENFDTGQIYCLFFMQIVWLLNSRKPVKTKLLHFGIGFTFQYFTTSVTGRESEVSLLWPTKYITLYIKLAALFYI